MSDSIIIGGFQIWDEDAARNRVQRCVLYTDYELLFAYRDAPKDPVISLAYCDLFLSQRLYGTPISTWGWFSKVDVRAKYEVELHAIETEGCAVYQLEKMPITAIPKNTLFKNSELDYLDVPEEWIHEYRD